MNRITTANLSLAERDGVSVAAETPAGILALIAQARDELQRIEEPREAASFVQRADAIRYLAEKANASQEVQNQAAEVAIRAKRRAGELLAADPGLAQGGDRRSKDSVSLDRFGVEPHESKRWQAVASIPEERFERHVAEELTAGRELTTAGVLRVARALEGHRRREEVFDAGSPEGQYRCLVIDPPWPMQRFIERAVRPNQDRELPYPTMTIAEIAELPIPDLADPLGCHVYLWVTHKFLPDGLRLLDGWGVRYQCQMTWVKNVGFTPYSWMYSTEHVLFGHIGGLALLQNGLRLDFAAPVTGHSRKPDAFYERVAEASPEPRLEMFARQPHGGFVPWGNQVAT